QQQPAPRRPRPDPAHRRRGRPDAGVSEDQDADPLAIGEREVVTRRPPRSRAPMRELSLGRGGLVARPRWYTHAYNRPQLYTLAAGLGWMPRPARLALARAIGRLAPRLMPAERMATATTLARVTGATGRHLEALIAGTFTDFAMCFSDLVSTNRGPAA